MTFQINANFVCYKSRPIKNTNLYHYMGSFKLRMHQNPFSAGTLPQTQLGSLRPSPRPPSGRPSLFLAPSTPVAYLSPAFMTRTQQPCYWVLAVHSVLWHVGRSACTILRLSWKNKLVIQKLSFFAVFCVQAQHLILWTTIIDVQQYCSQQLQTPPLLLCRLWWGVSTVQSFH